MFVKIKDLNYLKSKAASAVRLSLSDLLDKLKILLEDQYQEPGYQLYSWFLLQIL